jgi:hypothetical protein
MIRRFLPWILGAIYFLFPYDLFSDFAIGPGWLDDLVVLGLVWWWNGKRKQAAGSERFSGGAQDQASAAEEQDDLDPYQVLGVQPGASMEEIRSAYKRLVAKYHPDKVQHLGPEFQKLAHEKFVAVQQAYEKLSK